MNTLAELYLDTLKNTLTDFHRMSMREYQPIDYGSLKPRTAKPVIFLDQFLKKRNLCICQTMEYKPEDRINGLDWPTYADTMIGVKRLDNIEYCIREIIENNIPGDFIETGVWRGGAVIFMNAVLQALEIYDRIIYAADSFEGLPKPNGEKYAADEGDSHYKVKKLAISLEEVKHNFEKYNLLTENVKFLKGWFKDTLPVAPIEKLALLRLDGDMYESTMDGLVNLYPKLSIGGYIIIDDWNAVAGCKKAVIDYRKEHGITEDFYEIDPLSIFWKKESPVTSEIERNSQVLEYSHT